ncbi:TRAP transporter large permease [Aeromicrobium sp. CF4.19]|uniref:TRAP transporter large permease n=1 Tax=Aeromicrobium sp. CF4.19 TaxID=3373082 RepID=UPI003EE71C13
MSADLIVVTVLAVLILFLFIEMPVAFALATSGTVGFILLRGSDVAGTTLSSIPFTATSSYTLVIIPLYVALGMFALHGRLAERVYAAARVLLRRLPGGLGVATVAACTGFSAVSGSSLATAASLGKLSVGEMIKVGYQPRFAAGIVAIAGTLGILIPPSVVMVIYGVLARESVAELLVAGIVPGVLCAIAFATLIVFRARAMIDVPTDDLSVALAHAGGVGGSARGASVDVAPSGPTEPADEQPTVLQQLRALLWIGLIALVIVIGLFSGIFTVIESAAIGALVALLVLLVENLRSGVKQIASLVKDSVLQTAAITSMVFALVVGAAIFAGFLVTARVPMRFADWVVTVDLPPLLIVAVILLAVLPLGMFLEPLAIVLIVVPLVHPAVTGLGFEGVWFAVLFVMMLEIGLVTPPVGINTFVVSMASGVRAETVFLGVFPFVGVALAMVAVVFAFPELALWLPSAVTP